MRRWAAILSVLAGLCAGSPQLLWSATTQSIHLEAGALPSDFRDLGMTAFYLYDLSAIAVYKDQVQFYRFAPEVKLRSTGLVRDGKSASLLDFKPLQTLRFAVRFEVLSRGMTLICTHPARPRLSREGLVDFCGILSLDGKVVYQFPIEQRYPEDMLQIIDMTDDGQYAEVYLGKSVPTLDDRRFQISEPRLILAWWYPNRLVRYPGPWAKGQPADARHAFESVFRDFARRKRVLDIDAEQANN